MVLLKALSPGSVPPSTEGNELTIALPGQRTADVLSDPRRRGAQRLLSEAIEAEVAEWIVRRAELRDADERRQVVRNGS